ncbi:MAG: DUF1329 domain-containing protein [Amphritea sp.]
MFSKTTLCAAVAALVATMALSAPGTFAAISAEEVERLQADLTPVGAERAGNAEGTIPQWSGGLTESLPGWPNKNNYRPNPYADDKVQFTITAENLDQYADRLPEAAKAMLKAYPDSFKMNVYPTRRTAAYPQWYYDNIKKNATTANLNNNGNSIEGVWAAIPFPIPKNGHEVIWNHLLRFQGIAREASANEGVVYASGQRLDWSVDVKIHHTFYDPDVSPKDKQDGVIFKYSSLVTAPARDAGDGTLALDNIDMAGKPRKAWTYDPGERRVRRAPNLAFDTPDRPINVIDDYELFSGSPERYDFKLRGKKEMYIPYNNNELNSPVADYKLITAPGFYKPEQIRYELHRVWVVEATVKAGQRHVYSKRRFYVDEDTWIIMVTDKYDGKGNLWRAGFYYPVVASEVPLTGAGTYVHIDLKKNGYYYFPMKLGAGKGWNFEAEPPKSSYYTPAALRRRGR